MEKNTSHSITYFLLLEQQFTSELAGIRHWTNLKAALFEEQIWITGFTAEQVNSVAVKSILHRRIYSVKDNKLIPIGYQLPERSVPDLKLKPLYKLFPARLGRVNHNYFGVDAGLDLELVPSDKTADADAVYIDLDALALFLETAAKVKLQPLKWALINGTHAFVKGQPLPAVNGMAFYKQQNSFIPCGFEFNIYALQSAIEYKIDALKENWLVWNKDASYFKIEKSALQPLDKSSFNRTINALSEV